MSDQPGQLDPLARDIAAYLLDGARGVSLVGPQGRIDEIVERLLQELDRDRLLAVPVQAASATPDTLREAAARAHAGRTAVGTVLLLVVPDAGRLSAEMLRELEQAAEAAIAAGGLSFLLGSGAPLRSILRDAGLVHLHDCLAAEIGAAPEAPSPHSAVTPAPRDPLAGRPVRETRRQPRRIGRFVVRAAILAAIVVVALVLLRGTDHRPATDIQTARPVTPAPTVTSPAPVAPPVSQPVPPPPAPAPSPARTSSTPAPVPVPPAPARSDSGPASPSPLLLVAQPGDTLPVLYAKVYAGNTPPPYAEVVALNPVVGPGTRLIFPPPPGGWRSRP